MVLRIVLTVMPVCAHSCRKEADRRRVSDDITEKLKTWANDLCQSNVSVGDCVDVVHDFSKGRRIEAGAAFVKHIDEERGGVGSFHPFSLKLCYYGVRGC